MPDKKETSLEKTEDAKSSVMSETFRAQLLSVFGDQGNTYKPTEAQVDKILSLQEKGMDYIHNERTTFSPDQKTRIGVLLSIIIAFLLLVCLVGVFAPEYISQAIIGTITFLSGAGAGYGFGKSEKKTSSSDD